MKAERWKQIDELFDAALELEPEKRIEFLGKACTEDDDLRKEVEFLLALDDQSSNFSDFPASQLAAELVTRRLSRFTPGVLIGPYEILSFLGSGGMGEVFRAKDTRLEREVAVKILARSLSGDAAALSRFAREAKVLAALSHPNILAIYDSGTHQGVAYTVTELLNGQTLRQKLATSKLTEPQALEIGTEIANGLAAAHLAGIIHRDLKPENIFITSDGGVKILDFGLARRTLPEQNQTTGNMVMGTVPYMSPEQVRGEPIDARTDIFSFGAVLHEMLAGERAFARKTSADTISAILNEKPPQLSISSELNQIIHHCLEKNPEQRFQTAHDLLFALRSASTGVEAVDRQLTLPFHVKPYRAIRMIVLLILLLAIGGLILQLIGHSKSIESLAIMPFVNGSKNQDAEYLSDGITDSIIHNLSSLPNLHVIARESVFSYKGKHIDPQKVGSELNVKAVVTGSVVKQGDKLVIRANLIHVTDGRELWGQQYNRRLDDVLQIQREISRQISENLQLKLTGEQKKILAKLPTENSEAYRLYLKGQYHFWKNTEEDYEKARQYYQKALDLDPAYATVLANLGRWYAAVGFEGIWPPAEAWPKAKAASSEALSIDGNLGTAYIVLGLYECMYKWNWEAGERNYKRARELDSLILPDSSAGCLLAMGKYDVAVQRMKAASETFPLSRIYSVNYGQLLMAAGRNNEAIEQLKKTILLDPAYDVPHFALGQVYERKGMVQQAIDETVKAYRIEGSDDAADLFAAAKNAAEYQKAKNEMARSGLNSLSELAKEKYVSPIEFARLHARLNEKDKAFYWLEKAYNERSSQLIFIRVLDDFKNLRSDPRFDHLAKRIGLPSS